MEIKYWKLWKPGLSKPIYVEAYRSLVETPEQAYKLALQCGEVSGGANSYEITQLTEDEWKCRRSG
jgi:hypothetical protein